MVRAILALSFISIIMSTSHAYEQAFPRTETGEIELKTLPAGRLLECRGEGDYFNQSNSLFGPLFKYISSHDISMTTPVEAQIDPGVMYFWVAENQKEKADEDMGRVRVIDVEERLVAAIGERGGYSEDNYDVAKEKLLKWVKDQDDLEVTGDPFAVYWNGPMTPWFMKKFEVLVPVSKLQSAE